MATYVIGDVHGCYRTFKRLLERIDFKRSRDELWFVGDLVNRGPRSLEMLSWAFDHQDVATAVLGNHEIHLLGKASGFRGQKRSDSLDPILDSAEADQLLEWVRRWPLAVKSDGLLLVHAGVHPGWTLDDLLVLTDKTEHRLTGERGDELIAALYSNPATGPWNPDARGEERAAGVIQAVTRSRVFREKDLAAVDFTGAPEDAPAGCKPWYRMLGKSFSETTLIFGHWAAHGYRSMKNAVSLDTGCVYGGALTAYRLEKIKVYHEPLADKTPWSP